jgi:hypothetical protein
MHSNEGAPLSKSDNGHLSATEAFAVRVDDGRPTRNRIHAARGEYPVCNVPHVRY